MTIHFPKIESLKYSKFLLLGVSIGCIAIHLNVTNQSGNSDLLINSIIFWVAASSLIWKRRYTLNLKTDIISSFLGTLLITSVLLKSMSPTDNFLYVSPLISSIGLGLIASGFQGLKQYRSELLLLFFLGVPYATLFPLIDISEFTAKIAAFLLWYSGFDVSRTGVEIVLSSGIVEVYQACSGMKNILELWGLSALILVMVPTNRYQKILVPIVATLIGFAVNMVRVVLMAALVASEKQAAFKYWHQGDGSLVFSMISVLIFGSFCFLSLRFEEVSN